MTQEESKKTAIITGSGRGIGRDTAILLAKHGVNVVVCSRTENEINSLVYEIKRIGGNANILGVKCDVSISSQVISVVKSAIDKFGSETIDILVNNAGVAFNKKLIDTSEQEWNQTINTNLKGAFLFTKAVLPFMIKRRSGAIVNVNSGAGKTGFSNLSSYCASKFGLFGLAESLALEVDAYNIRVMTIFLGQVATKMWQDFDQSYYEKNKKRMLDSHNVAEKIADMIFDTKNYKNGDSLEMYNLNTFATG
ncbi:MAG TPA: SDR family oxidoreductase [Nitrososphaeraceae archaeon]|jgi:3-oxoacyl-[acyl-carrier protein] reductase|nr:SDR family oxidoreductase [Nitrososphaeraceae archaeon]